jgi:hypothetical protein
LRKIKVIALIVMILFGSFLVSKISDPEEIVPVLPPWEIEAVSDPPIGALTWPAGDPVLGVEIGTESRAYLLSLLEWHGVLNDRMSDQPIAVTYSVLSDSAAVYDRVVDNRILSFDIHTGVYKNGLVLRDRQTGSLWSQMDGEALMGPLRGQTLTRIAADRTTWSNWEALHPTTEVLLPPGDKDYGIHPFGDYRSDDRILFPHRYEDSSLGVKDAVLGLTVDSGPVAFPISTLSSQRVVMHTVGTETVVVTYAYGTAFAYDAGNRSFSFVSGSTMKDQNEDLWNMTTGTRESDDLALMSLRANTTTCYWFAWLNIYPKTSLYGVESRDVSERSWVVSALPLTVGLLLCLLVVLLDRYLERGSEDPTRPLKWIAFKQSILLAAVAIGISCILLFDSPGNLQIGNVTLQVLFALLFLVLGAVVAFEWYHMKGYEGTKIPIDSSEFGDNLGRVFAMHEIEYGEAEAEKLGFVDTHGGWAVSEPDVKLLISGRWLLMGSSEGVEAQDAAQMRRIVDQSLTMPEEEELA